MFHYLLSLFLTRNHSKVIPENSTHLEEPIMCRESSVSNVVSYTTQDSRTIETQDIMSVNGEESEEAPNEMVLITDHLTPIEKIILDEMTYRQIQSFDLRYRASHYDKEVYHVYIWPRIFEKNDINYPVRVYIRVFDESGQCYNFQKYVDRRDGNIFQNHYWPFCNKHDIKKKYEKTIANV